MMFLRRREQHVLFIDDWKLDDPYIYLIYKGYFQYEKFHMRPW